MEALPNDTLQQDLTVSFPMVCSERELQTCAGGVESMGQFKEWFFPGGDNSSLYCKYNNKSLQAYSAVMHFTGSIASIAASYFTQHWGRKGYAQSSLDVFSAFG